MGDLSLDDARRAVVVREVVDALLCRKTFVSAPRWPVDDDEPARGSLDVVMGNVGPGEESGTRKLVLLMHRHVIAMVTLREARVGATNSGLGTWRWGPAVDLSVSSCCGGRLGLGARIVVRDLMSALGATVDDVTRAGNPWDDAAPYPAPLFIIGRYRGRVVPETGESLTVTTIFCGCDPWRVAAHAPDGSVVEWPDAWVDFGVVRGIVDAVSAVLADAGRSS